MAAIDRYPDLKARMDREIMIARNGNCRDCEIDGIRRKWGDIAKAQEDAERARGMRPPLDRP